MKEKPAFRYLRFLLGISLGLLLMLSFYACEKDDPIVPRADYVLDISFYQQAPEVFIDSTVRITGTLVDLSGTKLENEKIYFTVVPDSIGNMTPPDHTFTKINDPLGFSHNVQFIARREGTALITAKFYIQDRIAAQDTLHVLVKKRGNE